MLSYKDKGRILRPVGTLFFVLLDIPRHFPEGNEYEGRDANCPERKFPERSPVLGHLYGIAECP